MPKKYGQKQKLLSLARILYTQTDEEHPMKSAELTAALAREGIACERKALYDDIDCLSSFGLDIGHTGGKYGGYCILQRDFELAELKLLVDAVQSSKFITRSKSEELITKLTSLCSRYQANQLRREVYVADRVKAANEKVYITVDTIHAAILGDCAVSFKYFELTREKKKLYHRDGRRYTVSPFALVWDDENYYLIAYDHEKAERRHFRVDKMDGIRQSDIPREGREEMADFDAAGCSKTMFGMFGGETVPVTLLCDNARAGVIFDRFGTQTPVRMTDDGHFEVRVSVAVSPQFFAWVFAFGGSIRITAPDNIRARYTDMALRAAGAVT